MCYSPEVSFGSAAALTSAGAFCLRTAARTAPWFWPFAVVPCLFGIQQASEGFVWLGLGRHDARLIQTSATVYLFFAIAFWPTWFSLSAALIEPAERMRRILLVWTVMSTIWFFGIYLPILGKLDSTTVRVVGHSIRYESADPGVSALEPLDVWVQRLLYALTVTVPILATSLRRLLLLPVALSWAAAMATSILFERSFTSVWCLWSAVASATLIYMVSSAPKDPRNVGR